MDLSRYQLDRREFLSAATLSLSALLLGFPGLSAEAAATNKADAARRVGISDEAYAAAVSRAKSLTAQLTLSEKISQVIDNAAAIARLNIPAYNYYSNEALHGLCSGPKVTSFPVPLALAASWNPELARKVYDVVADECRAHDNAEHGGLSFYSPITLNLHRDPRWGRCYEAPGEDPCLASTLAVQIIRGMQGDNPNYLKTTACSKHFICNNTDGDRESISATVDPRSFWEFYTRSYKQTIVYGDVFTLMSSYNAVNGVPSSANHFLLTDIVRDLWGFRGYITSDCDAVKDICDPHHYAPDFPTASAEAIQAGCDLNCWGATYANYLQPAVDRGLVTEAQIGDAVTHLLTVRILLGTLDPPSSVPYTSITLDNLPWQKHAELAVEAARQSLVLLKNENNFLPLDPAKIEKIAVIGPLASTCHLGGYSGSPGIQISPLQGIGKLLGLPVHLDFIPGGDANALQGSVTTQRSASGTLQLAYIQDGDSARYDSVEFTGKTEVQIRASSATNGGTVVIHLDTIGGPQVASFTVPNTGSWDTLQDFSAPLSGITGEHAIFVVFHGGGGYLLNMERITLMPVTAPTIEPGSRQIIYSAGCGVTGTLDDGAFQHAVDAAKAADVVVLVCGVDTSVSGEAHDRDFITLAGVQPDLIKAVYAANPKTVLVLSSNNSVSIEWEQNNLPAIIAAICAGQAQGTAIAETLFGHYNPGGKLPCTWYRSLDQLPDFHDYDIHKGRTYQYFEGSPLYSFGFGLSYTSFTVTGLTATAHQLGQGAAVQYSVRVKNTGHRSGAEVVQLYVVPPKSSVKRPIRQLAGFQRVVLNPGEVKTVVFEVRHDAQPFWYWSVEENKFVCQPGKATIEIGTSSADLPLKAALEILPPVKPLATADDVETVAAKSYIV